MVRSRLLCKKKKKKKDFLSTSDRSMIDRAYGLRVGSIDRPQVFRHVVLFSKSWLTLIKENSNVTHGHKPEGRFSAGNGKTTTILSSPLLYTSQRPFVL